MDDIPTPSPSAEPSRPPHLGAPPAPPMPPPLAPQPAAARPPRQGRGWKVVAIIFVLLFLLSLVFNPLHMLGRMFSAESGTTHKAGARLQEVVVEESTSKNKIAVIPIEGVISGQASRSGYTMVDLIDDQFQRAAKDERVKAVILKVNSPGGEVLASDDIYRVIRKFEDETGKPVVASMGSLAASGGYYVSAPCQWIVANEMTITGSIGVIMHGYNYRGLMDKVGIRPEVFKSGKFKDMLSPDKRPEDIDPQEREMLQSMVNETFDKFKSIVREGRAYSNKKNKAEKGATLNPDWELYADGRILSGKEALRYGFVDELGNFDTATARARKLAGITDATLIEYQQPFDLGDLLGFLGSTEGRAIKVDLGMDTPKLQLGRLYFICPFTIPH